MTSVNPCIGETWYYLIGDAVSCTKGEIVDITPYTVSFRRQSTIMSEPLVYPRSKIEFVERIVVGNSKYMCDND